MQPPKTQDSVIKVSSWLLIVYSIIEIIIYLVFFILSKIAGKYLSGFIDQLATNYIDFAFHEQVSKFASSWTINLILDSFVFTTEIFLLFSIIRIITAILILKQKKFSFLLIIAMIIWGIWVSFTAIIFVPLLTMITLIGNVGLFLLIISRKEYRLLVFSGWKRGFRK
ncbi:hypothetical protein BMT55_03245 [Listeria newyorkensis]|uniref:Uncharacterized protein n=1 Tax=Listeria newyorkensis TaxID=1497681 RepID=A0ABX4XP63_9LIST|nr:MULTISPECIES: hypothetical protein [Listeria]KGL41349.1 hypothetical protein EP56_12275 [Listeriaceae bacterium FSL A5-0209]KGL44685.1 hypothetical protein EP58_04205 [Listeria newyorkensis]KMT62284.1 hypothetical protein X559_1329 [Listeria newyorkensis]PNP93801.1 hypothetical protein BMT55_03245 [Listeria newyorkensis]RQW67302.1 hypothetical protein DUK53_05960 [Listeria sp. SHR_NRA_18]